MTMEITTDEIVIPRWPLKNSWSTRLKTTTTIITVMIRCLSFMALGLRLQSGSGQKAAAV